MKKSEITKIERHFYENKNHTSRDEFRIYSDTFYEIKSKSLLTKDEKEFYENNGKVCFHFMFKLKIFDEKNEEKSVHPFSSFEDLYRNLQTYYLPGGIDLSIINLTEQDYYNIITKNIYIDGSYKYYYCLDDLDIEIDTSLITFFDKSGNNIIDNLVFCENLLNKELTTLELKQKFLLLFNSTIKKYPRMDIEELFDKYCVFFEDDEYKICNSENDTYMFIYSPNFDIYYYNYELKNLKKFIASYEVNGNSKEWVFYAKNETDMDEELFFYKIPVEDEESFHTLYISEF